MQGERICGCRRCSAAATPYGDSTAGTTVASLSDPTVTALAAGCPTGALLVQHLDLAAADAGALLEVSKVLLKTLPLFGRTNREEGRLQLGEIGSNLFPRNELEDAELVELGGCVIEELGCGHRAGTADLITEPRLDLLSDDLGWDLEELRGIVGKDHGCDLVRQVSLEERSLLFVAGDPGSFVQIESPSKSA